MPHGDKVFRYAVDSAMSAIRGLTRDTPLEDIAYFVFHQSNGRVLDRVQKNLGIPEEKVVRTIETLGNTDAASIGITFDLLRKGRLEKCAPPKEGDNILMIGYGAGLKCTGVLYTV